VQHQILVAYLLGLLILYILIRARYVPVRLMLFLLYNGVAGGLLLWVINLVAQFAGLHIGLNPVTAVIAGILGLPGIAALLFLRLLFS